MFSLAKMAFQGVSIEIKSLFNSNGDNNVSFRLIANYDTEKELNQLFC